MEYLKIQNQGELDVRLISLMGGSTKQNNKIKIGKFGTGLKYSLAWLMRNNVDFKIFIGEREIPFVLQQEIIQDTPFDIVYIDGQRSSITTTMGMDWEAWMICREIWCNALDEGFGTKEVTAVLQGKEGCTTIYIQNTGEIKAVVDGWDNYFITCQPIYETENFAVYPAKERLCLYKQGVLIHKEKELKGVFSYDIKHADINELREYKGYMTMDIANIINKFDKNCAELFLSAVKENCFEADMDLEWGGNFGESWSEAIGQGKVISNTDFETFKKRGVEIDEAGLVIVPENVFKKLAYSHPHVSAVRRADKVNSFHEVIDKDCEHKINLALSMLEGAGYEINSELKWITGVFGNPNVNAKIDMDEKIIMYSTELKRKSTFQIVSTIIEENEHFISGHEDCTRAFQQHFIDLYARTLLDKAKVSI